MVILIGGSSHTGKTTLAQHLITEYAYPSFSIDHLKMGLIRSGQTSLTPESSDNALTSYLWPIVSEMVKTAIENEQNLIAEGCYIPYDWSKSFTQPYLDQICYVCLIFSERYIRDHWTDILRFASVTEKRGDDSRPDQEKLIRENAEALEACCRLGNNYILIDDSYTDTLLTGIRKLCGLPKSKVAQPQISSTDVRGRATF